MLCLVMNNILSTLLSTRSRLAIAAAVIITAGASVGAVAAGDNPEKPAIKLQVDSKAVNRETLEPASYSKVAKKIAPSVVTITTERKGRVIMGHQGGVPFGLDDPFFRQFFGNRRNAPVYQEPPQSGLGSGVVVTADGYIATNNHVIDGADKVLITLDSGKELKAKVVGRDPQTDIAVVKVEATDLTPVSFAESSKVEVGDRVLAIGNPFGIGETVTTGIISAKGRRPGLGIAYEDFIQTDAAINPGNSGGALVDIEGRLIGINTAILSRTGGFQGVGLAVPSDIVRNVVDSLVKNGKVVRGFLGVNVQNISNSLAENFELKEAKGAIITEVTPGSPAAKAGLQSGDILTEVNGKKIDDRNAVILAIGQMAPGAKVELTVIREGKSEKISATVGKTPAAVNRQRNFPRNQFNQGNDNTSEDEDESASMSAADGSDTGVLNGVNVGDLDPASRRQLNIPMNVKGALITEVDPNSPSAKAGLQAGDVILEINRKPVRNAEEAVKLSEDSTKKKTLLKLWSRGGTIYVSVDETEK
jgi:serine protease Do